MKPRIAIIGSCVTRDVWNLPDFSDAARQDLFFLARTSLASLFAQPFPGFETPDRPPPELTAWEVRMVADDVLKRGVGKLVDYRPTHLILDLIDERFNLLRQGAAVVTHSWELHLTGLDEGPLKAMDRLDRLSAGATALWRAGVDALAQLLKAELPDTRVIFHDARWSLEYLDAGGERRLFEADRVLWPGVPANIHAHNGLLDTYAADLLAALPQAFRVRAPAALTIGDERHRWGLSPFHYAEPYYRFIWRRLRELGCG